MGHSLVGLWNLDIIIHKLLVCEQLIPWILNRKEKENKEARKKEKES